LWTDLAQQKEDLRRDSENRQETARVRSVGIQKTDSHLADQAIEGVQWPGCEENQEWGVIHQTVRTDSGDRTVETVEFRNSPENRVGVEREEGIITTVRSAQKESVLSFIESIF